MLPVSAVARESGMTRSINWIVAASAFALALAMAAVPAAAAPMVGLAF